MRRTKLAAMFSEAWVTLIANALLLLGILANIWQARQNNKLLQTSAVKQEEQHLATNSRMDQLLVATGAAKHAEGLAEGRAEGKNDNVKS